MVPWWGGRGAVPGELFRGRDGEEWGLRCGDVGMGGLRRKDGEGKGEGSWGKSAIW